VNDLLHKLPDDALDYLKTLIREGVRPSEALARLQTLRQRHPDTEMELVWEEQAYDASLHYDLLLRRPGEGTVSLSFCPEHVLPWPLRGVHRVSDRQLVRVNNTVLDVAQAIACIDFLWDEAGVVNRLVHVCLIQEALQKDPVELSAEELQQALDSFRRAHQLYTSEDTRRWMERRGLTHEKLERLVGDEATVARLRDRVAADRVDDYFEEHRADFETARIARVQFTDKESALRTIRQLRSGEVDFYEAAERQFLATGERPSPSPVELFAEVRRRHAPAELAATVFAAAPGDLLGPVPTEEGWAVVRVLSFTPARLDQPTRLVIKKTLFEEWLDERRQAARIEWFWGNTAQTG
jgi:putative peptide maturation system protein